MKSLFSKKFVLISLITVLLIGTGIATTLAYLRSTPNELTNTFTIGNVTTKIVETEFYQDGTEREFVKKPYVENIGANDCLVRVRVVRSPESALVLERSEDAQKYWKLQGEYYYYEGVLPAPTGGNQSMTAQPVFEKVIVNDLTIDSFEVTVYQEAVQTRVYAADGTYTEDPTTIWNCYETGIIPGTFAKTEQ